MAKRKPNSQYNVQAPDSFTQRVTTYQRRRMYDLFIETALPQDGETILDVGVTSDRTYESSNYLEAWYPQKSAITAAGIDDARFLETLYPGVKFVHANGLELPFEDRSFDIVHSSAVLEHVGSFENQVKFVAEMSRVARRAIFLTTPNRWFPIEFHTVMPLVHWLPKPAFRGFMRRIGMEFFAQESNLNLMTKTELRQASPAGDAFKYEVKSVSLAGWPSNLILTGKRYH